MLTITMPETGKKLEVADQDVPKFMTWEEAIQHFQKTGSGWRLPAKEELKAMYDQLHSNRQGNFQPSIYWSSSEAADSGAWDFDFGDGTELSEGKDSGNYVRGVRAI